MELVVAHLAEAAFTGKHKNSQVTAPYPFLLNDFMDKALHDNLFCKVKKKGDSKEYLTSLQQENTLGAGAIA